MQGDSGAVLARRGGVGGPLGVHPGAGRGGRALGGQAHHAPLQRHALLPPQGPRTHRTAGQSVLAIGTLSQRFIQTQFGGKFKTQMARGIKYVT